MNNLTQREKFLIYAIVGILPLVLLFFGFNWFMGQMSKRSNELNSVQRTLGDMELRASLAQDKSMLKNEMKQRSLSSNLSVAQGEYREWLRNLVENELEFPGTPEVKFRGNVPFSSDFEKKPTIFNQLSFQLDCQGSYQQVVDFLYRFYEKNYIQRISRLDLNLARSKKEGGKVTYDRSKFIIKAQIQVLSLVDADDDGTRSPIAVDNTKLFYKNDEREDHLHHLKDYHDLVLRRNLFGFPNNAPDFGSRKKEFDFEEGDRVSVRLSADDEDDDDLQYTLTSTDGKVDSGNIEQSSRGRFKIDVEKLGSYEFKASVVDENYYPKKDDMIVVVNIEKKKVTVSRPPPKKPTFNPLKFTTLEAIVRNFEGNPICWINVRPYGKMHKVGLGAEFQVGESDVKIITINRRDAVISLDGDHYLFQVNDSLGDPQGKVLARTPKDSPDAEDEPKSEPAASLKVRTKNPEGENGDDPRKTDPPPEAKNAPEPEGASTGSEESAKVPDGEDASKEIPAESENQEDKKAAEESGQEKSADSVDRVTSAKPDAQPTVGQ
ncbi:MAG: hypothetical protein VX768_06115 [Planctomycetota bacterium]|nr:hypothetical protein [Planctomycetota bacterium]